MNRTLLSLGTTLFTALFIAGCCCCLDPVTPPDQPPPPPPSGEGIICLWVSSDKDTYASYGRAGEDAGRNFGSYGSLVVANGPLGIKQTYLHFTPPTFPAGTEILEAKIELFHGGKNEDGTSDDRIFNVAAIRNEPWSPGTLTWNNRPDRGGLPTPETELRLRSQNWSGTPDIAGMVREMIAEPSEHHGFLVWYRDPSGQQLEKGFYSNNDTRRKQNDLGLSPRLLLRVKLPDGKNASQLNLGYLPADTDVTVPRPVTMVLVRDSDTWPADWNVSK